MYKSISKEQVADALSRVIKSVSKEQVVEALNAMKPYLNEREAVDHALLFVHSGFGIESRFSIEAVLNRLNDYRRESELLAIIALNQADENGNLSADNVSIARFRVYQAREYADIIQRLSFLL